MRRSAAMDETWMRRAVDLARRGEGMTRPNPPVGALLVRGGKVVGEGFHRRAGGAHAEIHALHAAGPGAAGATLYVTLEPCSTAGRTPPCTDAILEAGVARVVAGAKDPNPAHAGRGLRLLRRHGVRCSTGVLRGPCEELIAPFRTWVLLGRPRLTLKLALTLDGRIADRRGRSKWITGPAARERVQALRRRADVIMVGAGTARADDPSLLPRPAQGRTPWRVVVSSTGRLPRDLRLLNDAARGRTVVTVRREHVILAEQPGGRTSREPLSIAAAPAGHPTPHGTAPEWLPLRTRGAGVSLKALLRELGRRGALDVLCEGGGHLAGQLVRDGLVDEYVFFFAPSLLGAAGARPALAGVDWLMGDRPQLEMVEIEPVGSDLYVRARPRHKEE